MSTDESMAIDQEITQRIVEDTEQPPGEVELTDSEGEDEFVRKYGDVNFQYIKRPRDAVWFIRPHALNYFKDGVLYRTKGERSSSKTELFLDLMYVGIIANLAGDAAENAGGEALLKYVLLFMAVWTVWCDIKDFTNYYYNEDLSQKLYILWILVLLTFFCNNQSELTNGRLGTASVVVPYMLCRLSLAISVLVYTIFIPEHRVQQRIYGTSVIITSCLWIIVIFVDVRAKIGVSIVLFALEQLCFVLAFHPLIKRLLKLNTSTALNIEHEVERFSVFVTIAIGEFLYKVVATHPLGTGFTDNFARGVFVLIIAYVLFWIYNNGSTSKKATHALRHSGFRAILWIYSHLPLVASIVLAADASGDLCTSSVSDSSQHESNILVEEGEENIFALCFYFTGGICVCLLSMAVIGLLDDPKDPPELHIVPRFWRVIFRVPVGLVIVFITFAELNTTLLMGIVTILLVCLLVWESITLTPKNCLPFGR